MGILSMLGDAFLDSLKIRRRPKTIQLPITSACNSKCKTCNVWKIAPCDRVNIDKSRLERILQDPYLNAVESVGINGGEPFLHPGLVDVFCSICSLPKLKRVYLITNGLMTELILDRLEAMHKIAKAYGVGIILTISYDGIGNVYSEVRGVPNGYKKVLETVRAIAEERDKFCDSLSLGITVSNHNIDYIAEIESSVDDLDISADYHLAVPNRRIGTESDYDCYSVLCNDRNARLATQFFFGQFKYAKNLKDKIKYFQIYHYLASGGRDRISSCQYRFRDITIDESCNLYFCAKESCDLGSIESGIKDIVFSDAGRAEQRRICSTCSGCGHYIGVPTIRGMLKFVKECLSPGAWVVYRALKRTPL